MSSASGEPNPKKARTELESNLQGMDQAMAAMHAKGVPVSNDMKEWVELGHWLVKESERIEADQKYLQSLPSEPEVHTKPATLEYTGDPADEHWQSTLIQDTFYDLTLVVGRQASPGLICELLTSQQASLKRLVIRFLPGHSLALPQLAELEFKHLQTLDLGPGLPAPRLAGRELDLCIFRGDLNLGQNSSLRASSLWCLGQIGSQCWDRLGVKELHLSLSRWDVADAHAACYSQAVRICLHEGGGIKSCRWKCDKNERVRYRLRNQTPWTLDQLIQQGHPFRFESMVLNTFVVDQIAVRYGEMELTAVRFLQPQVVRVRNLPVAVARPLQMSSTPWDVVRSVQVVELEKQDDVAEKEPRRLFPDAKIVFLSAKKK